MAIVAYLLHQYFYKHLRYSKIKLTKVVKNQKVARKRAQGKKALQRHRKLAKVVKIASLHLPSQENIHRNFHQQD